MENEGWEDIYMRAATETDFHKVMECISAARQAIQERLLAVQNSPQHHEERERIERALRALAVVEAEAKRWKSG